MADDEILVYAEKCLICNQPIWTTDEYEHDDDPITFCDPQCPNDGATQSRREHEDE